ncbi:hypothetical protein EJ04DRAFT_561306 [Polyplosphaeria fusca]|uniref:Uncharacterized protein n=1 Tax=Polyplosphaeria fusca TaxID=682080 RepID=A0A9P4R4C8_9PLEO|nr:hypothetical protein EJ04DRAFT_561306 [Polyplosphaeria fusca]
MTDIPPFQGNQDIEMPDAIPPSQDDDTDAPNSAFTTKFIQVIDAAIHGTNKLIIKFEQQMHRSRLYANMAIIKRDRPTQHIEELQHISEVSQDAVDALREQNSEREEFKRRFRAGIKGWEGKDEVLLEWVREKREEFEEMEWRYGGKVARLMRGLRKSLPTIGQGHEDVGQESLARDR